MGKYLNLIHFSDLHLGWDSPDYHFNNMRDELYDDIKITLEHPPFDGSGEIHLVIFTGDLTFSGSENQFIELSRVLDHMWDFFDDKIDSTPALACIPGNHDANRPEDGSDQYWLTEHMREKYFSDPNFYNSFWEKITTSSQGKVIQNCFKEYTDWYSSKLSQPKLEIKQGIMPGDFSAQFEKNGISVGLVGLNSAFLHLGDNAFKKIEINPLQLFAVCNGDPSEWLKNSDFNYLLTHHGPDWYYDQSKTRYNSEIYKPERFSSHIYGHIHDAKTEIANISGSGERRYQVGKSLYGMKECKIAGSKSKVKRSHGYSLIQLTKDDSHISMKLFPRASVLRGSEVYEIDRDPDFSLDRAEGWVPPLFQKQITKDKITVKKKPGKSLKDIISKDQKDIYETREKILKDENYLQKLKEIEAYVTKLWKPHSGTGWTPMHDANHNRQVEKALYKLIPENKYNNLQPYEWFILLSSIWLHEIGMIIDLFGQEDKNEKKRLKDAFKLKVREIHHERACKYIEENHKILGITGYEKPIQFCCRYHRKSIPIPKKVTEEGRFSIDIDIELLVAYLRLALATHLDVAVNDDYLFELMHTPGLSWEDRFHWQKQKWIDDIIINHENYLITVMAYAPPPESFLNDIFPDKLIEDMREGLLIVRDTLAKGKISFFYDVEHRDAGAIDVAYINQMQLIRSNIDLEETSSATQAYNTVLVTLEGFTNGDLENSMSLVESYFENIKRVLNSRPCHTLIRKLSSELSEILDNIGYTPEQMLIRIHELVQRKQTDREDLSNRIKQNSKPFLSDGKSILIYGYSTMVIQALESIEETLRKKTEIFIAECRGKTQFDLINSMKYNDGLHYAKRCRLMGFKKLYFIPDISIANLMKRGFIGKVLFGANGIDKKTDNFGHTCGHLMVADLAFIYNVPLYVITDSSKIGELGYDDETNREINWLPKIKKYSKVYDSIELLNPREDTVGSDRITMIITENGVIHPRKHKMFGQLRILYDPESSTRSD